MIENALTHGGLDVAVQARREETAALVEVRDRGTGIDPEQLAHLFERFYKADPARAGGGSGLGLAIALENARLLRAGSTRGARSASARASPSACLLRNRYAAVRALMRARVRM